MYINTQYNTYYTYKDKINSFFIQVHTWNAGHAKGHFLKICLVISMCFFIFIFIKRSSTQSPVSVGD